MPGQPPSVPVNVRFVPSKNGLSENENESAKPPADNRAGLYRIEQQLEASRRLATAERGRRRAVIKLVNEAANQYFKGNAQLLRKLEAVEKSLSTNSKIVVPTDSSLVNVIGNLMGADEKKEK